MACPSLVHALLRAVGTGLRHDGVVEISDVGYATSTGGVDIAYQLAGPKDGPRVVVVPGFVTHLDLGWDFGPMTSLARAVSSACRMLVFDKRGTGLSGRDLGIGSLAERSDDVRAVMDAAGWEHAHLIGISEGGPMSILFAATYPDRVSSLSLYGTAARFLVAPDYPFGFAGDAERLLHGIEKHWGSGDVLTSVLISRSDLAPPGFMARLERNACTPKVAHALMRRNFDIDVRELLPTLHVPTRVVHITGDPAVHIELGRYLAGHIEGATLVEIPGDFHATWAADMDPVGEAIAEFITGTRTERTAERVLATVLFTDIVDSTRRASQLGDRQWRTVLDRHDVETQRCVEQYGGRIVKQTGDGMLATFDGPARGVQCAHVLHKSLAPIGLTIRAGLHTGEVERRGDDVGGIGVHIGARVAGLAQPGEVLVSRTVRDLVVGSDLRFEDRGTHDLKGVEDAWQLYSAVA